MSTFSIALDFKSFTCGECGGVYALTQPYVDKKSERGGFWTCPYCKCSWGYPEGGSENTRLKRELENAKARERWANNRAERASARAEQEARRAAAFKGQVTKVKKRVAHGVCPCCTRSFQNLARHMRDQHPDWAPDAEPGTKPRLHHRGGPWYDVLDADGKRVGGPVRGKSKALKALAAAEAES